MATAAKGVRLSDLSSMNERERERQLAVLFQAVVSPLPEQAEQQRNVIQERITLYENRYKMTSEEMMSSLSQKKIQQTSDFATWIFLLKVRDSFEEKRQRPSRPQSI